MELFGSEEERWKALEQIKEAGFGSVNRSSMASGMRMEIGIKKLLSVIEMARQEPDSVADRLSSALLGLKM